MKFRRFAVLVGMLALASWIAVGCSDVNQLMDPDPEYQTLTVAYGNPGPSATPCDDVLPVVDGVATSVEWNSAKPHFVKMSGADGNGGRDFSLEIRALWTDEGRLGGTDRIYFLIRYEDDDLNSRPDDLAYVRRAGTFELCDDVIIDGVRYCVSQIPEERCDTLTVASESWTRLNPGGKEDQVMLLLSRSAVSVPGAPDVPSPSNLTKVNGELLDVIGPEAPQGVTVSNTDGIDVWVWRAGRTNLHPVPQFPDWMNVNFNTKAPLPADSRFAFNSGFCEDLWVNGSGLLVEDDMSDPQKPFEKNFDRRDPVSDFLIPDVPERLTQCPPFGREPSEEEVGALNGGVAKDLGLWWPTTSAFRDCDTLACSRITGTPPKWSQGLLGDEYDRIQGWGMEVPFDTRKPTLVSNRDVRAKSTHEALQEKGFGVRTLEIMRDLNTGNTDDLVIDPTDVPGVYRIVIGVFDNSGKIGSGSTEILLEFEAPKPEEGSRSRC